MNSTLFNTYIPTEEEAEKASNSYIMSLLVIIVGLPIPLINLLATLMFFVMNRKSTKFVRWHCTQALFSQFVLLFFNSFSFWWTISILFGNEELSAKYLSYLGVVIVINVFELINTVNAAIQTRKGKHIEFFFFGPLTNLFFK